MRLFSAQQAQDAALRAGTDSAVDQLAVLKDQQGGDAHDVELAGQLRLLVHVDFAHLDVAL